MQKLIINKSIEVVNQPIVIGDRTNIPILFLNSPLLKSAPQSPFNLQLVEFTATTVELTWTASPSDVDSYTVYVFNNVTGDLEQTITGIILTEAEIFGLTTEEEYLFWVTAVKNGIESEESNTISVTPIQLQPDPPQNFAVELVDPPEETEWYTDFEEYTLDEAPEGWTAQGIGIWEVVTAPGAISASTSKVLNYREASAGTNLLTWMDLPIMEDMQVEARMLTRNSGPSARLRAAARMSDTELTTYWGALRGGNLIESAQVFDGTFTAFEQASFQVTFDVWYRVKVQIIGNNLKVNIWNDAFSEPPGWIFEDVVTDISSGRAGLALLAGHSNSTLGVYVDWFRVNKL